MPRYVALLLVFLALTAAYVCAQNPVTITLQSSQAGNAPGVQTPTSWYDDAVFTVTTAGLTGTVNFETANLQGVWGPLSCRDQGSGLLVTTTTTAGTFECLLTNATQLRARTSGVTAGNVTVTVQLTFKAIRQSGQGLALVAHTLTLQGSTSGMVTLGVQANAGGWTLTLPANAGTAGSALITDGTGLTSWQPVALLGASDVFTASQTVQISRPGIALSVITTGTGPSLTVQVTDNGTLVGSGAILQLVNNDQTPNNQTLFSLNSQDNASAVIAGARIAAQFTSHTAGAVSADYYIQTRNAGTMAERMRIFADGGMRLGLGSSIDQGSGKLDVQSGYYLNGTAGTSHTYTMCASGACATTCTIITQGGIITGGTC